MSSSDGTVNNVDELLGKTTDRKDIIKLKELFEIDDDISKIKTVWGIYEEFQTVILTFCLTLDDIDKRQMLIKMILIQINDFYKSLKLDIVKLSIFIFKLNSKDLENIEEIYSYLEESLSQSIDKLLKVHRSSLLQKQETNQPMRIDTNKEIQIQDDKQEQKPSSTGFKLKALKFSK